MVDRAYFDRCFRGLIDEEWKEPLGICEVLASMTKNLTLKLNVDICILTVIALNVLVPELSNPQITTSVGSKSSIENPARIKLRTGSMFTADPGSMRI